MDELLVPDSKNSDIQSIDDWRREIVDDLIRTVYDGIESINDRKKKKTTCNKT